MASGNGFYGARQLLHGNNYHPAPPSGLTLQITSGNVTLMNFGATAVTVTDQFSSPVTGCTLIITDGTKCTANAQRLVGASATGSTTVIARKTGYVDSAAVTITCAAAPFLMNLISYLGTNTTTNGASVTSWVDQGTGAQTFAEVTNPPTYLSVGATGGPALLFNNSTQLLSSPSTTAYNLTSGTDNCSEGVVFRTTADSPSSNRTQSTHYDSAVFRGVQFLATTTNVARCDYGTGGQLASMLAGASSVLAAAAVAYVADFYSTATTTNNLFYVNGTQVANNALNWRDNNTTVVYRINLNFPATGNYTGQELYWKWKSSRTLTTLERNQLFLAMDIVRGL